MINFSGPEFSTQAIDMSPLLTPSKANVCLSHQFDGAVQCQPMNVTGPTLVCVTGSIYVTDLMLHISVKHINSFIGFHLCPIN